MGYGGWHVCYIWSLINQFYFVNNRSCRAVYLFASVEPKLSSCLELIYLNSGSIGCRVLYLNPLVQVLPLVNIATILAYQSKLYQSLCTSLFWENEPLYFLSHIFIEFPGKPLFYLCWCFFSSPWLYLSLFFRWLYSSGT